MIYLSEVKIFEGDISFNFYFVVFFFKIEEIVSIYVFGLIDFGEFIIKY